MRTKDMAYIAMFSALIAICAWISVPAAVPFTMQTFGVFAAVGILGGRRGTLSILVYILLGAVGLPVFSGFRGGPGVLLGTTGGYIAGFLCSALLLWALERFWRDRMWLLLLAMFLGMAVCYLFGTFWYMLVYSSSTGPVGILTVLARCVFPFLVPDALKISLAAALSHRLRKSIS
ncbi:biotin transporter BioY [Pseudoflavonifractor sp. 524-17]|nr:biotin transporter BioY [Pseudoflavonifractor sp. 524-17]